MTTPPIRLPSGVRDFLPRAAARRRALADRLLGVFEAWGYARIITPVFEHADVLERGLGRDARAAAIRFVEAGTGEIVALRPDITPQVARIVATRLANVEGPIRLCYEGAVHRIGTRELVQCEILQAGIELVDAPAPGGDAEVLAVAAAVLAASELSETRLDLGHVAPARFVLDIAPEDVRARLVAALGKKDRRALRAAARGLAPEVAVLAEALGTLWGPALPTLERALAFAWPASVRSALDGLATTLARFGELADLTRSHPPAPALSIDLGDLRGFDYYTGVRFAGYAAGAPDAVLRGGRYDELIARYGHAAPATGFAVDVDALAHAQHEAGVALPPPPLGIAVYGPGAASFARALRELRTRAVTTETAPTAAWLRGAGFDVAVLLADHLVVGADGVQRSLPEDPRALVSLLEEDRCPS